MNGRCETDPLDRAINVCGSCYGEFCESCLVMLKGRRHPVCTRCARVLSGVRPGLAIDRKGPRNSAKRRREALLAAAAQDENTFAYFEPEALPAAEAPEASRSRLQRLSPRKRRSKSDDGDGETAQDEASSPPPRKRAKAKPPIAAVDQLAQLRAEEAETSENSERLLAVVSAVDKRPDELPVVEAEAAGPDREKAEAEKAGPDLEQLELEKADLEQPDLEHPDLEQREPERTEPETVSGGVAAEIATPDHDSDAGKPDVGGQGAEPVETAATLTDTVGEEQPGATEPQPLAASAIDSEAVPTKLERNYPERRKGEHLKQQLGKPKTAPMIGEIQTIGGRRSTDAIEAETVLAPPLSLIAGAPDDGGIDGSGVELGGVDGFDAHQAGTEPATTIVAEQTEKPKHDVDANGNWVPPILRGMAVDARKAAGNLPRRRSTEGSS